MTNPVVAHVGAAPVGLHGLPVRKLRAREENAAPRERFSDARRFFRAVRNWFEICCAAVVPRVWMAIVVSKKNVSLLECPEAMRG